jgi:hypothetical protein
MWLMTLTVTCALNNKFTFSTVLCVDYLLHFINMAAVTHIEPPIK